MASPEVTRWRAVPGVLVPVPGQPCMHGMSASYVGRSIDHDAFKAGETDIEKLYPVSESDEYCAFPRAVGPGVTTELYRAAKHGDLAPGDATTATHFRLPMKAFRPAPVPTETPASAPTRTRRTPASEASQ